MGQGEVSESQVDGRTIGELQVKTDAECNRLVWDARGMMGCWTLASGEPQLS